MKSSLTIGLLLPIVLVITTAMSAQTPAPLEWHKVRSDADDFSVTLPTGYLVHKDVSSDAVNIVGYAGGVSYAARFQRTPSARRWLASSEDVLPAKGKRTEYQIGDSLVNLHTYQGSKIFRVSIITASPKGYYNVGLSAPSEDSEVLNQILASLQLAGKAMVKSPKAELPVASSSLRVTGLEQSDIVTAAVKGRPRSRKFPVEMARADFKPDDQELIYSRRLMILSKARAMYNDEARSRGVQGTIRTRILFKGDGTIGKVTIVKGLPHGLNEKVLDAIRTIKFLPAEVDGRPADTEWTLEYTFSIY